METHIKILAWLHILFGVFVMFIGVVVLIFFGGLAGLIGFSQNADPDAYVAIPILGAIGGFVFILMAVLSLPGIIAGLGLLKRRSWARIVTIILCAVNLMNFPLGTALGAYGLWVLLNKESEAYFQPPVM